MNFKTGAASYRTKLQLSFRYEHQDWPVVCIARAPSLALLMITNLEGALILVRSPRELTPLDVVVAELGPVLDAAVRPQINAAARATSDEDPG